MREGEVKPKGGASPLSSVRTLRENLREL